MTGAFDKLRHRECSFPGGVVPVVELVSGGGAAIKSKTPANARVLSVRREDRIRTLGRALRPYDGLANR